MAAPTSTAPAAAASVTVSPKDTPPGAHAAAPPAPPSPAEELRAAVAKSCIEQLVAPTDDGTWELGGVKDGVRYWTSTGREGFEGTTGMRCECRLPPLDALYLKAAKGKRAKEFAKANAKAGDAPPDLLDALCWMQWDDPEFSYYTDDPMCEAVTVLEELAPDLLVIHEKDRLPWPLDNREFVSHFTRVVESPDSVMFGVRPCRDGHPDAPPAKGYVRGQVEYAMRLRRTEDGSVDVNLVMWYDLGGSVPKKMMSMMISMYAAYPNQMRALAGKLGITRARMASVRRAPPQPLPPALGAAGAIAAASSGAGAADTGELEGAGNGAGVGKGAAATAAAAGGGEERAATAPSADAPAATATT